MPCAEHPRLRPDPCRIRSPPTPTSPHSILLESEVGTPTFDNAALSSAHRPRTPPRAGHHNRAANRLRLRCDRRSSRPGSRAHRITGRNLLRRWSSAGNASRKRLAPACRSWWRSWRRFGEPQRAQPAPNGCWPRSRTSPPRCHSEPRRRLRQQGLAIGGVLGGFGAGAFGLPAEFQFRLQQRATLVRIYDNRQAAGDEAEVGQAAVDE
jgi:hypothetical protein